jgi:hypothetical protein
LTKAGLALNREEELSPLCPDRTPPMQS